MAELLRTIVSKHAEEERLLPSKKMELPGG
jgi:hypothetical protein